jgi:hypothetical protein
LLSGPRHRDWDQGQDRKRREGVEKAPEVWYAATSTEVIRQKLTARCWQ